MGFAEERAIAEQALTVYDLGTSAEPVFPPVAQRILRAREALALTQNEVAARWGEQASMYWDLELYDDEAFTVISVRELQRLAAVLTTSVTALLFGEDSSELPAATYAEVIARLRVRMAGDNMSIEQLGDVVGWDLQQVFADPDTLADFPIYGLRAVCQAAGVDWVAVLETRPVDNSQAGRR